MTNYVALLRAVNVGGTGKLPMADLRAMAEELGFKSPRTYIASGNLLFRSDEDEGKLRSCLEQRLADVMGKSARVTLRTAEELESIVAANPFRESEGKLVQVLFLNGPPGENALEDVRGLSFERLALGRREIYVDYSEGLISASKLKIRAASTATARNMNTVGKLAMLAKEDA